MTLSEESPMHHIDFAVAVAIAVIAVALTILAWDWLATAWDCAVLAWHARRADPDRDEACWRDDYPDYGNYRYTPPPAARGGEAWPPKGRPL